MEQLFTDAEVFDLRVQGMVEEVAECEDLQELRELWCINEADGWNVAEVVAAVKEHLPRIRGQKRWEPPVQEQVQEEGRKMPRTAYVGPEKRYRMRSFKVEWATTPQIHAVAQILAVNFNIDEVVGESTIVAAMEANVHILDTTQGGKRIWDYYKGKHPRGLMAHGNIEEVK